MSSPGLSNDFASTRARASAGDDAWMRQLAGEAPAAQPERPAGPSPAAPASPARPAPAGSPSPSSTSKPDPYADNPSQPFGLRFENWGMRLARGAQNAVMAPEGSRDKTLGQAISEGLAGVPAEIGKEFVDNLHAFTNDAFLPVNVQELKKRLGQGVGSPALDLVNAALSPLTGALTSAAGRPAEQQTGVRREIIGNVLSGAIPIGDLSKIPLLFKSAKVAEEGAGAAKAAMGAAQGAAESVSTPGDAGAGFKTNPNKIQQERDLEGAQRDGTEKAQQAKPRAFDIAGEEPGSDLKITPELRQRAADFLAGKRDNPIDVHLDQLGGDDVSRRDAVMQVAKVIPKDEVKPIDVSTMGAYSLNLSPDEVMTQIRPNFPSDEVFAAAAMVQNSAAKQFWQAARTAMETGTPEATEAATRAYALFNKYTGAFRDAKTDWGRAGRIQQEAMGLRDDYTKHIQDIIANVGPENVEEVIRKVNNLDDPAKVSPFVSSLRWMTSREGMLYGWYNWLLSNPAVIVKKITSDASIALGNLAVRGTAETLGRMGLNSGQVQAGETMALFHGYVGSMGDAFRAAGKALKSGQSQFVGNYNSLMDGQLLDRAAKLANGAPEALPANAPTAHALDYLRMAMPTSWIGAADDFAKMANYRAELHALVFREASARLAQRTEAAANGGGKGNLPEQSLAEMVHDLVNNVSPEMHGKAVDAALRNTLAEPLDGIFKGMQDQIVDRMNIPLPKGGQIPVGRIIMPFTKISANVMRMMYRNSPLPLAFPTASFKADMLAGGARRDLANAQVGLGTAATLAIAAAVMAGRMTGEGPGAPELARQRRDAGIPSYSIKMPDGKWYDMHKIAPLGDMYATIADTIELMRYAKDEDNAQLATSLALGVGHTMLSQPYLSGFADTLEAMNGNDRSGERWFQNMGASFAAPGIGVGLERATDPWMRSHRDLVSTIASRTPGWAENLPPLRNRWGDPLARAEGFPEIGGISRMLSPVGVKDPEQAEPIDRWIWTHRDAFPDGPDGKLGLNKPGAVMTLGGAHVQLNDQQLDRRIVLAGNEAKDANGLGAKDALNALVNGNHPDDLLQERFNRSTPERQAVMVAHLWTQYRNRADAQLLNEDQNLRDTLHANAEGRAARLRGPVLDGGSP